MIFSTECLGGKNFCAYPFFPPLLHCRPSAVPKGKAAVPVATDGKVGPSTLESKRGLLERLEMSERSLEVSAPALLPLLLPPCVGVAVAVCLPGML